MIARHDELSALVLLDDGAPMPALSDLRHPVAAYLSGMAASSRR